MKLSNSLKKSEVIQSLCKVKIQLNVAVTQRYVGYHVVKYLLAKYPLN